MLDKCHAPGDLRALVSLRVSTNGAKMRPQLATRLVTSVVADFLLMAKACLM